MKISNMFVTGQNEDLLSAGASRWQGNIQLLESFGV